MHRLMQGTLFVAFNYNLKKVFSFSNSIHAVHGTCRSRITLLESKRKHFSCPTPVKKGWSQKARLSFIGRMKCTVSVFPVYKYTLKGKM